MQKVINIYWVKKMLCVLIFSNDRNEEYYDNKNKYRNNRLLAGPKTDAKVRRQGHGDVVPGRGK